MTQSKASDLGQVRIHRDPTGVRTQYEDVKVGADLGSAILFLTQEDIDLECMRRDYYHPWYSVGSPFGGTIAPVDMTYRVGRSVFSRHYNVVGLLYKWAFEFLAPVLSDIKYEYSARISDKWIKNDREFVSYEGTCRDEEGHTIFTTRRSHVLDFIKRSAPRVGEGGVDFIDGRSPDSPMVQGLAAMAAAAAAVRPSHPSTRVATPRAVIAVPPLASRDTRLGAPMPSTSKSYSQARFDRDWASGEDAVGAGPRSRHYDSATAKQEGLPAPVTAGTWIMGLIFQSSMQYFGEGWAKGGRADLTMVRPVFAGEFVTAKGFVKGQELLTDGSVRLICEAWVENQHGETKTFGTVSGIVR